MNPQRQSSFVDTNILVYAYDEDAGVRHDIARDLLFQLWQDRAGMLSTQVLQEFYAVVTRKLKPPIPRAVARLLVADFSHWCAVDTDPLLIISASRLEEEHTLAFWDALIVEAARRAGATFLLSEDLQDGRKFGELTIRNPFQSLENSAG